MPSEGSGAAPSDVGVQTSVLVARPRGIQQRCPGSYCPQLNAVSSELPCGGLGSAFRFHGRDKSPAWRGREGPAPRSTAPLIQSWGGGPQRKLQSGLSRKENDRMEGWLMRGGETKRKCPDGFTSVLLQAWAGGYEKRHAGCETYPRWLFKHLFFYNFNPP